MSDLISTPTGAVVLLVGVFVGLSVMTAVRNWWHAPVVRAIAQHALTINMYESKKFLKESVRHDN